VRWSIFTGYPAPRTLGSVTARRISGWPAWQVVYAAGVASTVALLWAGIAAYSDTANVESCPGARPGADAIGVLCPHPILVASHPHQLRGTLLIGAATAWAVATVMLARSFRSAARHSA
jgi:hypothetical protein